MRWSVWLFVLAEFCRKCKTKGTWRGVCSGVPSGVRGQSSWGRGQGKPHEVVALGWNWFHWLSESVTRCATRISVFAGTTLRGRFPNIFSSVLSKSRKWPRRTVGGVQTPQIPRGLATADTGTLRTDRRTDGHTDRFAVALRVSW